MHGVLTWVTVAGCWVEAHQGALTALATVVIAAFTVVLACSTRRLWRATERLWRETKAATAAVTKQVEIAQQEFVASHRPKIITRLFRADLSDIKPPHHKAKVFFHIVNAGESDAIVTEIGIRVFQWSGPFSTVGRDIEFGETQKPHRMLKSGEEQRIYTQPCFTGYISTPAPPGVANNPWWCIGYITYRDANGVVRKTGLCRKWNSSTKSWDRYEDEDWEYSY